MQAAPIRPTRTAALRVFLLAFLTYAYFMPRWADWNADSRLDLVHAVVDKHTVRIDAFNLNTWDKAVFRGHYYSDKAPGTAILGIPVYAAFVVARGAPVLGGAIARLESNSAWNVAIAVGRNDTQTSPGAKGAALGGCQRAGTGSAMYIPWGNRLIPPMRDWALSKYVVTVGVDALISALFVAFFFWFLGFFVRSALIRWLLSGLYAVGSTALAYSTNLYSHQLAAAFLFTAFGLLYLHARSHIRAWAVPAAGFLLGFAVLTEYTTAALAGIIGVYAVWFLRRRPVAVGTLAMAGVLPILALLTYNYLCFGSPLDTGYSHDFCWSPAQGAGFQGFTLPQPGPLWDLTFSPFRGLFYTSPFLLLAAPGVVRMFRRGQSVEALLCIVGGLGFIVLLSAYWGWNGGRVDGPRYLVPVIPFLAFPVIFFLEDIKKSGVGWLLVGATAAWSLFATGSMFLGGALFPPSRMRDPLFHYSLPSLASNQIAPNAGMFLGLGGWSSLLPLVVLLLLVGLVPTTRLRRSFNPRASAVDPQPASNR